MLTRRSLLGLMAVAPLFARPAFAASPDVFSDDGLAIRGTDPVAYFTKATAVAGDPTHSLMWRGTTWLFESAENMTMFEMNPEGYAPQYGGYCAFAVSRGYVAPIDPDAWSIVDDKLYLNFSISVRSQWSRDIPGNIEKADANWPSVLS